MTPVQVRAHLIRSGVIDKHGVNDRPRIRHCKACGRCVWAAWRNGTGTTVLVDDVVLTPLGEYQTLMAGRESYDHWWGAGLVVRQASEISQFPADADTRTHPIRPQHLCGAPEPDHVLPAIQSRQDDSPPF